MPFTYIKLKERGLCMLELMTVGVEGGLTMANITTALTDCFSLMAGVLEQLVSQPVLLCLFAVSFIGVGVSVFKKIKRAAT
jgi:hypothetical protein